MTEIWSRVLGYKAHLCDCKASRSSAVQGGRFIYWGTQLLSRTRSIRFLNVCHVGSKIYISCNCIHFPIEPPSRSPNVNAIARFGNRRANQHVFYPGGSELASTTSLASRSMSSLTAWRGDRGIAMRPVRAHSRMPKGAMSFKKASILAGFADLLNTYQNALVQPSTSILILTLPQCNFSYLYPTPSRQIDVSNA